MDLDHLLAPPQGFVLAGPSSAAVHHLHTKGLVVDLQGGGTGVHAFQDGTALVAVDGKVFPLPLRMLGGRDGFPTPQDAERIRALHSCGWAPHDLWWAQVATDPFLYGEKLRPVVGLLGAYLAGKVRALTEIKRIELVLQGAAPDVPEDAPSEDACLMARVVSGQPSGPGQAQEAQDILDGICALFHPFLFDTTNPPRSWRWVEQRASDQNPPLWVRETPFVFRMAMTLERVPNAHETMALAKKLRDHTGLDIV